VLSLVRFLTVISQWAGHPAVRDSEADFPARSGGDVTVLDEPKVIWTATLTCWRGAARRAPWMWPVVVCGGV
jgi:hypothetical protein